MIIMHDQIKQLKVTSHTKLDIYLYIHSRQFINP